ncbi:MAG: type I DNA topoisomerase [Bacilli bacterium]|nr:type I DNA topoisomerase [Bacilli bacterium]
MTKKLVIVESPAKTKTIGKYLGNDYKVVSSKGHIRDLSTTGKYGLGIDIEDHFKPKYTTIKGKKKVIDELKKDVKNSDFVYLATDPDREGEAISWHLYDALELKDDDYNRIVFNEITKNAVTEALKHPRKIDKNLVNSQETRRILDRIIGFRLSKLMQYKTSGTSAGRVQSVALKLIVDKEREINEFIKEEYWTIKALFNDFDAELVLYNHKKIDIKNEIEANDILNKLSNTFKIENVEKKSKEKATKFPFTTSTLQQESSSKLNMNAKKTMMIAQKLYEGIELEDETVGLITYMRTDSTRLSNDFITETKNYIKSKYGENYVGIVKKSKKTENVQDAHEAIRPTSITRTPEIVRPYLNDDEFKLYRMIYYRALAYLMAPAKTENTTVIFDNNNYQFKTTGQIITFDGYLKVYSDYEDTKENIIPPFDTYKSNIIVSNDITKEQHFTQPPARYTEAKLVKAMEELGIGRPSTYATIMSNIKDRGYVNIVEKKFVPTEIGIEVTDKLQEYFSSIINVEYTANMEEDLDKIAEGNIIWYNTLDKFYKKFEPLLEEAFKSMEKEAPQETGENCPNCGSPLVIRKGRYGKFTACSNYPECKYIKQEKKEEQEICDCPNCDGKIVEKKSRKGKTFYGCNNYPTCKTAYWDIPIGEKCPECGSMLVEKKKEIKCSSCDYKKEI